MNEEKKYPIYGDGKNAYEGLADGLYLGLFHGYKNADERQEADDWGPNGAVVGPLQYLHVTYQSHFKYRFLHEADAKKYGIDTEGDFDFNEGCLVFDSMEYGDITTFQIRDGKLVEGSYYCDKCKGTRVIGSAYWGGDAPCPKCAPTEVYYGYGIEANGSYRVIESGFETKEIAIEARAGRCVEGASILRIEILNN